MLAVVSWGISGGQRSQAGGPCQVCARYRSWSYYSFRRSVLRQTQKHFRRILTGIHTTQLWGHSSPWASGLQWTASALKVDTQRPSVSVTHSSLIFGTHISHIPIFYWHLFCIVWVRPRRLTITCTGVDSFVLSVWQWSGVLSLFVQLCQLILG